MVTQLLDQFLSLTYWGPLDYLILDMPPGTGDIQLTLSQKLDITAAVIVTTPQELSFVDVERGIEMFDSVNIPCIAVVENMSFLEVSNDEGADSMFLSSLKGDFEIELAARGVDSADELVAKLLGMVEGKLKEKQAKYREIPIFGKGHKTRLADQWGISNTFSVPLLDKISANGDSGTPFVVSHPESKHSRIYKDLAESVVQEVSKLLYSNPNDRPQISYNEDTHSIAMNYVDKDGKDASGNLFPAQLRRDCKCAACVEELSGRQILKPEDVPDSIKPSMMKPTGKYALSVDWSDGHRSLYPYRQLKTLLQNVRDSAKEMKADAALQN